VCPPEQYIVEGTLSCELKPLAGVIVAEGVEVEHVKVELVCAEEG